MKKHIILALAALLIGLQALQAVPAYPGRIVYTQPDGTKIVLRQHGDEFAHWMTDAAGKVVRLEEDGFIRRVSDEEAARLRLGAPERRVAARASRAARAKRPTALGQKHYLVILVEFSDLSFSTSENPQAAFTALLNEPGYSVNGGTGSARDFYYENSHGLFEPVFDVYGPVKLENSYKYYGNNDASGNDKNPAAAVAEGCKALDGEIDFSRYDNDGDGEVDLVFMYYAGYGEADSGRSDTIWPHQWAISGAGRRLTLDGVTVDSYACTNEVVGYGDLEGQMCAIGAACHEFGHAMGLPDFYDADYATNGQAAALFTFSPMDSGTYNNESRTPPYFNIEERIILGWLDESAYRTFSKTGNYTLPSVDENVAYRTPTDMDGEYFVYECRGANGWDASLPAHGLIVYHVDKSTRLVPISSAWGLSAKKPAWYLWENWDEDNAINENGSHPCFYIVPAADQGNLLFGHTLYWGAYYFDESYAPQIPFPGSQRVTTYVPLSWNGVEGDIRLSQIAYAGNRVTLRAEVPTESLAYPTIAENGPYTAGDRFTFELVLSEVAEEPASVVWYYDDEPAGADSVTLTAGEHTVDAYLTFADGARAVVTREIIVR